MTYAYDYDECNGYDCMTGGFRVKGPDGEFVIDQRDFGQQPCDYKDTESRAKAEAFTRKVVAALNGSHDVERQDNERVLDELTEIIVGDMMVNPVTVAMNMKKDAERYRWLRDPANEMNEAWFKVCGPACDVDMDAVIDAAMLSTNSRWST